MYKITNLINKNLQREAIKTGAQVINYFVL